MLWFLLITNRTSDPRLEQRFLFPGLLCMSWLHCRHPGIRPQVTMMTFDLHSVPSCVYLINAGACVELHTLSKYFVPSSL